MSDIRIKDLPETLDIESDDYVAVDNAGDGTRKYTLRQLIASVGAPEFVVNINASGDADKTLSDITGAIASGYIPVAVYNDEYYQLTKTTGTSATFTKYNELGEMVSIIVGDGYTEVREDTLTTNNVFNYSGVPGENVSYALDDLSNNIGYLSDRVNDATNDVRDMRDDVADLDFRVDILEASGGGSSGDGLTQTEKNLILTLFSKAAYAADDAGNAYNELEGLWATVERTITYNLSHVASSNTDTSIISGSLYATTFGVQDNYTLNIVEVTMGGEDITSTAYRNGTITIPRVTGNIVITATAVLAAQSITAVYTQSGTVYDTDSLDSLKADLVVTANYSGGTSETVPASDYTLSGTLAVGTSNITVSYAGQTTTFNVTVTQDGISWDYTMGMPADNGFTRTVTESADPVETIEEDGFQITVKGPSSEYIRYTYDTTQAQSLFEAVFKTGSLTNQQIIMYMSTDAQNTGIGLRIQYSGNYKGIYVMSASAISDMTLVTSIELNTQYKVKIELVNNLANIYVNDTLMLQGQTLYSIGASDTRFQLSSTSSSTSRINAKLISMRVK